MAAPSPTHHPLDQQLLNRVVFSAGLDHHSNPLLVVCPSRLAPSSPIDLGRLTLQALTLFSSTTSSGPYSLVIFASPSEHAPSLKQLISSYQLINQPIRKNLQSLLVVHPSFWSKITLQVFFKTVVSSKISTKLKWVKDLSTLASLVPIHQICIPPEVYKYDLTIEPSILIPPSSQQPPVFKIPLDVLIGPNSELGLPQIIIDCTLCIRSSGLKSEGLFRRPPSLTTTQTIREAYDRRQKVQIEDYPDAPFLAASLIKLFLRELPDPIFCPEFYPIFKNCPSILSQPPITSKLNQSDLHPSNEPVLQYVKDKVLLLLPQPARTLLDCVLKLSHDLALHSEHNKMDPRNLATCLAPTMIRSNDLISDAMMCKFPSLSSTTSSSLDSIVQNPAPTTFSSILQFMISCYPLFEEIQETNTSPTGSSFSTPGGSIITGTQSIYSSKDTHNSILSLSESSLDSIASTSMTSIIFGSKNGHQPGYGTNKIRRVPSSIRSPLKNGYLPIRCPVSQVGLSHAFTLGKHSCSPSTPLAVDHQEALLSSPIRNQDNLQSPPSLTRHPSLNHLLASPSFTSSSFFLPAISDRIHTTIPVFNHPSSFIFNSTLSVPLKSFNPRASYLPLDELD